MWYGSRTISEDNGGERGEIPADRRSALYNRGQIQYDNRVFQEERISEECVCQVLRPTVRQKPENSPGVLKERESNPAEDLTTAGFFIGKGESMKKAAIIMGSDSDWKVMRKAAETLKSFGIPFEAHVYSAHRTPEEAGAFAENARKNGFGVLIAGAGMSAALAGALAAKTTLPVIGVPLSATLQGTDALLTTVMMPPGIPVAAMGIDGAKNAAILAAEILSLEDDLLAEKLAAEKEAMRKAVLAKDAKLQEEMEAL